MIQNKKRYKITCHVEWHSTPMDTLKEAELHFRLYWEQFMRDWVGTTWPLEITEIPEEIE